ncbi:MAG: carbon storage regulator CsrA [Phycisphaeraceae bacterium]|nr:MAG: carbon storage regulator CsrA [Phycisphaeraceae bacterium]
MLVLSRQCDETIMIGDEIEITIVDIRGDKVRLGINAPGRITVHRKEVYEAIRRENESASRLDAPSGWPSGASPVGRPGGKPGPAKHRSSRGSALAAGPAVGTGIAVQSPAPGAGSR